MLISIQRVERWSLISFFLYGFLVLWLSLRPGSGDPQNIPHIDKLAHFLAYFGYATLAILWVKTGRFALWLVFFLCLYGVLMEFLQGFIPMRDRSFLDVIANTAGSALGVVVSWKLHPRVHKFFALA